MQIRYWNRKKGQLENESVYGDSGVRLLYGNNFGFAFTDLFLAEKAFSRLVGDFQDLSLSSYRVAPFIRDFNINMEEFEAGPFRTFNDFFVRRFRPGIRSFPSDPNSMGAFAEARYLAFKNVEEPLSVPIKGLRMDPMSLLGSTPNKALFKGGPCLLARLCPVDYHRFHFPDEGRVNSSHRENGKLHSVNPMALRVKPDLFLSNERQVSVLDTKHFGKIAYVEVGALCVGRIVQTHSGNFNRGDEKGYFLFGGSTIIVYGEPGAWEPSEDLLRHTAEGIETLVELGSPIAKAQQSK